MQNSVMDILKKELGRRCANNPRYSLRAFAKTLGLSPANLSLILNGKRQASRRTLERIFERLELRAADRESIRKSQTIGFDHQEEDNLDLETFERVSHWVSYAILSLTLTKGFQSDAKWIARRLGISVHEARLSIDALKAVRLLNVSSAPWKQTNSGLRIANRTTTAASRNFQR